MSNNKPERRAFRYSAECPEGQIFVGEAAIAAATEAGWTDSPPSAEQVAELAEASVTNDSDSEDRIQELEGKLDDAVNQIEKDEREKLRLAQMITDVEDNLDTANNAVSEAQTALAAAEKSTAAVEKKLAAAEKKLAKT